MNLALPPCCAFVSKQPRIQGIRTDLARARARANRAMIQSARLASEQARIEAMLDGLYHLDLNAEDQNTQIAACNVCLNRVESPPRTMTEIAAVCGARGAERYPRAIRRDIGLSDCPL